MKLILGALALFLQLSLLAQTVVVMDTSSNERLSFVNITSQKPIANVTTNSKGEASLVNFKGSEAITFSFFGYDPKTYSYDELANLNWTVLLTTADFDLEPFVLTHTKWNQRNTSVPSTIKVISKAERNFANPQTSADLLNSSGQVFIQKSQLGGGSPMIRGFSANRLLISVDGVRMNTAIFRSGNLQNILSIDPLSIESAEVFFGSGSVIYGSDAMGGVMNFQTLKPLFSATDTLLVSGNVFGRTSSANFEKTGHINLNIGGSKLASLTSISYSDFDDLRMGRNNPIDDYERPWRIERINGMDSVIPVSEDLHIQSPTGYEQINLLQKLRWRPNKIWDITYNFQYSTTSDYDRWDRLIQKRNGEPRNAEWYYGPQEWIFNNISVINQGENDLYDLANYKVTHQKFSESRHNRRLNSDVLNNNYEMVDALNINFDYTKDVRKDKDKLYYGLESVLNWVESEGISENIQTLVQEPTNSRYPDALWQSYAAYVHYDYHPTEKLSLQGGVRYNHFFLDAQFDTTLFPLPFDEINLSNGGLNGSLGISYDAKNKLTFRYFASTGFRAPNVDDIGKVFDSEPGSVVVPADDIRPEYAYNQEIGISKIFTKKLKLDISIFYTYLHNSLTRRSGTINNQDSLMYQGVLSEVQQVMNAAKANIYGGQISVEYKFAKRYGLLAHFNYQDGYEILSEGESAPVRHVSPAFGDLRLYANLKKFKLEAFTVYNAQFDYEDLALSEQNKSHLYALDENGNPYAPAWMTYNFRIQYMPIKTLRINASVENITDLRYRTYSSGITAPGRNFILSLNYQF